MYYLLSALLAIAMGITGADPRPHPVKNIKGPGSTNPTPCSVTQSCK